MLPGRDEGRRGRARLSLWGSRRALGWDMRMGLGVGSGFRSLVTFYPAQLWRTCPCTVCGSVCTLTGCRTWLIEGPVCTHALGTGRLLRAGLGEGLRDEGGAYGLGRRWESFS